MSRFPPSESFLFLILDLRFFLLFVPMTPAFLAKGFPFPLEKVPYLAAFSFNPMKKSCSFPDELSLSGVFTLLSGEKTLLPTASLS